MVSDYVVSDNNTMRMWCLTMWEFKDVVFEDVVSDNNGFVTLLSVVVMVTAMSNLLF